MYVCIYEYECVCICVQAFIEAFLSTAVFSQRLSFFTVLFAKSVNLHLQLSGKCVFDTLLHCKEYVVHY